MKTEPKIEQWHRDAAEEICGTDTYAQRTLAEIIAKHAPTNQPTTNIWRPVSVRPTREDGCELRGNIAVTDGTGHVWVRNWNQDSFAPGATHWTRTADLLALAPLPVEKTQEEKDAEFIQKSEIGNGTWSEWIAKAIAYGRATAAKETSK